MADKIPQNIDECFLLDFMPEVADFRDITNINKQSEHVIVLDEQHSGNSQLFLNKLIDPEYQTLMDGCPKNLFQQLSPMVNLYKVFYDPADPKSESESIKFQFGKFDPLKTRQAIEELRGEYGDTAPLYGGFRPGHLAPSITEANIVFDGQNPAEANSFVKANLKLYFPSADALFFKRSMGSKPISFSNLIERPSVPKDPNSQISSEDNHRIYSQDNFRIKMELFYLPKDSTFLKDDKLWGSNFPMEKRRAIMELISNNRLTLYLNIVKHEFSFDHDNVNLPFYLNVQYIGAVESAMNTKDADILKDPEYEKKMTELRKTPEYRAYQAAKSAAGPLGIASLVNSKAAVDAISHRNTAAGGVIAAAEGPEYFITPDRVRDLQAAKLEFQLDTIGGDIDVPGVTWGSARTKETLGAIQAETTAWAKLGVEWDVRKSLGLQEYAAAKRAYDRVLKENNMLEEQQLSRGYSRIIKELYGGEAAKAAAMAGNKAALRTGVKYVYSVGVPATHLKDYLARREGRKLDQETKKSLEELEKTGDPAAADRLRAERENAQNDVRTFYKQFWKKLGPIQKAARDVEIVEGSGRGYALWESAKAGATSAVTGDTGWDELATAEFYGGGSTDSAIGIQEKLRRIARLQAAGKSPEQLSELLERLSTRAEAPLNSGEQVYDIDYFYLGDLMDIVLRNVHASNDKHRLNLYSDSEYRGKKPDARDLKDKTLFVLGNITWNDFASNGSKTISLDRVPVSMKLFMEFWTEKVVKRQRKAYPLNEFIKDVMTNLVKAVFTNKCRVQGEPTNNLSCKLEHVSLNPDIAGDPTIHVTPSELLGEEIEELFGAASSKSSAARISLTRPTKTEIVRAANRAERNAPSIANIAELGSSNSRIRKRAQRKRARRNRWEKGSFDQLKTTEIIYMYATNSKPDHLQGNRQKDVESGVIHIEVGNPNTPLKEVGFNKSDQPFYLEAKGETAGVKDNSMELSEPYNLDITLYGLTYARPGQHFYLKLKNFGDPSQKRVRGRTVGFGLEYSLQASPSRRLGLGGYYMMNKVEQNFRAEGGRTYWETLTQALWTSFGDQKAENNKTLNNTPSPVVNPGDQTMTGIFATMNSATARIDAKLANANITAGGALTSGYMSELLPPDTRLHSGYNPEAAKDSVLAAQSPVTDLRGGFGVGEYRTIIEVANEEAEGEKVNPLAMQSIVTFGDSADTQAAEKAKRRQESTERYEEERSTPAKRANIQSSNYTAGKSGQY